jgi:hypothetical protein
VNEQSEERTIPPTFAESLLGKVTLMAAAVGGDAPLPFKPPHRPRWVGDGHDVERMMRAKERRDRKRRRAQG